MPVKTLDAHIEVTPGVVGGKPCVAGRRIAVHHIVRWHERQGRSAEEIAAEHDLSLADVYAALAYYHDHRDAINRELYEDEAYAEAFERTLAARLSRRVDG